MIILHYSFKYFTFEFIVWEDVKIIFQVLDLQRIKSMFKVSLISCPNAISLSLQQNEMLLNILTDPDF